MTSLYPWLSSDVHIARVILFCLCLKGKMPAQRSDCAGLLLFEGIYVVVALSVKGRQI